MASLKVRLEKLESRPVNSRLEIHRIAWVIVGCDGKGGGWPDTDIIGYQCEDVSVWREIGELAGSCLARCQDAVDWGDGYVATKTFGPVIADIVNQLSLIGSCTN
jgi:hypothetical protein